jgi:hypothetical protein
VWLFGSVLRKQDFRLYFAIDIANVAVNLLGQLIKTIERP